MATHISYPTDATFNLTHPQYRGLVSYDIANGSGSVILAVVTKDAPTGRVYPGDPTSPCSVVFSRPEPGSWNLRVRVDGELVFEESGQGDVDALQATRKVLEAAQTVGHMSIPARSYAGVPLAEWLLMVAFAGSTDVDRYLGATAMEAFLPTATAPQVDYLAGVLDPSNLPASRIGTNVGSTAEDLDGMHVRLYKDGDDVASTVYHIPTSPMIVGCLLRQAQDRNRTPSNPG